MIFASNALCGPVPFMQFNWSNNSWLARSINPYYGRSVQGTISHGFTDIVFADTGSVTIDDGEELDKYNFTQLDALE